VAADKAPAREIWLTRSDAARLLWAAWRAREVQRDGITRRSVGQHVSAFREELLQFPAGKYDDQVDALSLIGQMLDRVVPGRLTEPEPENIDWTRTVYLHRHGFSNTLTLEDLWKAERR
jgi:hypothetical protein